MHSPAHHQRYCTIAGEIAHRRGTRPAWLEGRLYQFGRQVGTYERFADTQLALCQQRLGDGFPTTADTWHAITSPGTEVSEGEGDSGVSLLVPVVRQSGDRDV